MTPVALSIQELIQKKRDGGRLSDADMDQFVSGTVDGDMQDCQIGESLFMATLLIPHRFTS